MHPRSLTRFIATTLVAAAVAASSLKADEIKDLLKKAESAYESGDYSKAISSLDDASQLIRQKKGESLTKVLPDALKGWEADEPSTESAAGAMFGGMVTAQRQYTKGDANVAVKITTDSPLLQNMMSLFTNPMLVGSSGATLETVKGQKAVVKFNAAEKSGEISIVVAGKVLVSVEGFDASREDLMSYAAAVDYSKLESL